MFFNTNMTLEQEREEDERHQYIARRQETIHAVETESQPDEDIVPEDEYYALRADYVAEEVPTEADRVYPVYSHYFAM